MVLCHAPRASAGDIPCHAIRKSQTVQFLVTQYNLWTAGPMLGNALAREILC